MSEFRLGTHLSSAFACDFDLQKVKMYGDAAETEIAVGSHQFGVVFPTDGLRVRPEYLALAHEILQQIVELDAVATRTIDGTEQDGALFAVEIISDDEVDLRYSAVSWNSEWSETFKRTSGGQWMHQGIRRYS